MQGFSDLFISVRRSERLTEINTFEKRCILFVVLLEYINHSRNYEC